MTRAPCGRPAHAVQCALPSVETHGSLPRKVQTIVAPSADKAIGPPPRPAGSLLNATQVFPPFVDIAPWTPSPPIPVRAITAGRCPAKAKSSVLENFGPAK